jgi:hypothetical protein
MPYLGKMPTLLPLSWQDTLILAKTVQDAENKLGVRLVVWEKAIPVAKISRGRSVLPSFDSKFRRLLHTMSYQDIIMTLL